MLTKDEFETLISLRTGLDRTILGSDSRLDVDLGLDSFGLLEVTIALAEIGVKLDEREWFAAETVGGLYDRYRDQAEKSLAGDAGHRGSAATEVTSGAEIAGSAPPVADGPLPPRLTGQFFRLVPVLPSAASFLYGLAVSPDVGFRWRYRGSVPSYQQFEQDLWQGILAQFLVESIQSNQPAGHLIAYNPDLNLGHVYVGAAMAGQYTGSGIAAEPVALFIDYLFDVWPFRKLYLELPEFNYQQFASAGGKALHVEARLRDHDYYRGRRWDRLILAVYRPNEGPDAAGSSGSLVPVKAG